MTPWQWFWLEEGDDGNGGWCGEHDTREQAVFDAQETLGAGVRFYVIEARSSTAEEYEGADFVPFLRTRGKELLTNGPSAVLVEGK